MSENEEKSQSTTFGTIGFLASHPLAADPNETEPNSNDIIANIIKDAIKIANEETSDFDDEDIQRKMNDVINDLQSESIIPDDHNHLPRKSVTSAHFIDNQENNSTPAIIDSSSNNLTQGPIRSMSESALIDHHDTTALPLTLPVQQNENSTDEEDFDGIQTNNTKQNDFDQTARVGSSRPRSGGNENQVQLPDETDTDREVAIISRRPSRSKSPVNRPRSPTPDDSRKTSKIVEPQSADYNEEQKQTFEHPTAIISPASRRESTSKNDQQQQSRSSSTLKSKFNENSSESSNSDFLTANELLKLIKSGEQLQIPTNDIDNQRLNSPPPSSPSTTKQMVLINPLLGSSLVQPDQQNSRPPSQRNRQSPTSTSISNEKLIDGDIISSKSRRSSNTSQQQRSILIDQKSNSSSNRKGSNTSEQKSLNKKDSRRSSIDVDVPSTKQKQERILSNDQRQSPLQKRSGQQSRKNSNVTTDRTVVSPIKIDSAKSQQQNHKRSSVTDSDNEHLNNSKLPRLISSSQRTTPTGDKQTTHWTKQVPIPPIQTSDDENRSPRPQSPNVEQIAERNQHSSTTKKRNTDEPKKKDHHQSLRRSNSAESVNHIPLVDDKSLDSTSGNNTETENLKQQRVKSKKKDMETNTDSKNDLRNGSHHQQQESNPQKSSKATKSMSDHPQSIRHRTPTLTTPDTEPDSNTYTIRRTIKKSKDSSNENKDPVNVNVTVLFKNSNDENDNSPSKKSKNKQRYVQLTTDIERHTQSDTEQIINEKQKKRRRPKRISRTTQTYECVFRRMEREQHDELRPTSELEKNIQTRKSRLRPRTKSPKRQYPVHLSTNAFKIEEILPKQSSHTQRNQSKPTVVPRSNSPQNGKLLILRPTLPIHHTDAVNVQRISLQYAIDLIPNENKSNESSPNQRHRSNTLKQSEQTHNLPMIRASPPPPTTTHKSNPKDKSGSNRMQDRTYHRKDGGTV